MWFPRSFFGNIFVSPPKAYYCNGKDFDRGLVPGRLGSSAGTIIKNPFSSGSTYCRDNCAAQDAPNQNDGYKACAGFNHVVTVWRNFDPNTDYKVCNYRSGKCLDIDGVGLADGAKVVQWDYNGRNSQRWKILQVSPGKYKVVNKNSGKALDTLNGLTANATPLTQYPYWGGAGQKWSFAPTGDGSYKFSPANSSIASLDVPGGTTTIGTALQLWQYYNTPAQHWVVVPAN